MEIEKGKPNYTLYGVELSLYTGKARSYLRYKGVDWQEKCLRWKITTVGLCPRRVG